MKSEFSDFFSILKINKAEAYQKNCTIKIFRIILRIKKSNYTL